MVLFYFLHCVYNVINTLKFKNIKCYYSIQKEIENIISLAEFKNIKCYYSIPDFTSEEQAKYTAFKNIKCYYSILM